LGIKKQINKYANKSKSNKEQIMSINRADTKKRLLQMSKDFRGGKFTQVSKEALDELEGKHEANMRALVRRHPSMGKTIRGTGV